MGNGLGALLAMLLGGGMNRGQHGSMGAPATWGGARGPMGPPSMPSMGQIGGGNFNNLNPSMPGDTIGAYGGGLGGILGGGNISPFLANLLAGAKPGA